VGKNRLADQNSIFLPNDEFVSDPVAVAWQGNAATLDKIDRVGKLLQIARLKKDVTQTWDIVAKSDKALNNRHRLK
jgi:hypothetical protein